MNGAPRPDRLICTACAREAAIATVPSTCPVCDGILELLIGEQPQPMGEGLWRWHDHLPLVAPAHRVSLGEAGTPLLPAPRLGRELGLADLWIKNESLQPTGSFKDRALALATSLAVEYGRLGVVLSSSGNAGAAAAAYAARAGLRAIVLVPAAAVPAKLKQIRITGAQLVTIDGATHDCCRLPAGRRTRSASSTSPPPSIVPMASMPMRPSPMSLPRLSPTSSSCRCRAVRSWPA
jgi:threonine synthase